MRLGGEPNIRSRDEADRGEYQHCFDANSSKRETRSQKVRFSRLHDTNPYFASNVQQTGKKM